MICVTTINGAYPFVNRNRWLASVLGFGRRNGYRYQNTSVYLPEFQGAKFGI